MPELRWKDSTPDRFRRDVRLWFSQNMSSLEDGWGYFEQDNDRLRELVARLYDAGLSGLCIPSQYGGQDLDPVYQRILNAEALDYEMPWFVGNPGLGIIAPLLMQHGTGHQLGHIRKMIQGKTVFVQLMSEPTGGSDMAGARMRADPDGDGWKLNGQKIWSSGAWRSNWGLVLARTDWTQPKHAGLGMFLVDLEQDGVEVRRIVMADGSDEFCEVFFTDAVVTGAGLVGSRNAGWEMAQTLLNYERQAVGGGSPYVFERRDVNRGVTTPGFRRLLKARSGQFSTTEVKELGASEAEVAVAAALIEWVTRGVANGKLPPIAGSMLRLNSGLLTEKRLGLALKFAGKQAAFSSSEEHLDIGASFLVRQASSIGGGTVEMQRNLISERLLGMPREHGGDHKGPYRDAI